MGLVTAKRVHVNSLTFAGLHLEGENFVYLIQVLGDLESTALIIFILMLSLGLWTQYNFFFNFSNLYFHSVWTYVFIHEIILLFFFSLALPGKKFCVIES